MAIALSLLIAATARGLPRDSPRLGLDGVPGDRQAVADWLDAQEGEVHARHIWPLSTPRTALAVHLVWEGRRPRRLHGSCRGRLGA